ncbi:SsgA family sporulation/cell division regulator [Streptomyces sp. NPDC048297]|uniref:SsgA family sporulation/cell division regulator n=1 Tax=Streptomyces sp. NPDC048297 TaxID=3365531 RepID=UPI00370FDC02
MRHSLPPSDAAHRGSIVFRTRMRVTVDEELPVPLPAELRYATTDPYAVCLSLGAPSAPPVDWFFARSLLSEGRRRPAGEGNVVVFPRHGCHPDSLRILLRTRHGAALLEVKAAAVTSFLARTDALVPPGTEHRHIDLDGIVERLTADSE